MNNMLSEKDSQALLDLLVEQLGVQPDQLTPDARIQEDLGADSLTVMEITMAVEERFNLSIPDEEWEEVSTVGDLFEALAKLIGKPA
ncbi:MAG TPA: acyl carrier protein [Candidatus Sulfotelmatobacter sp.]|nr:acyl carrier protein [Candidatus Sulfotelmatobacter sp.]